MSNVTRYEPFREFDDLFKGLLVRPMRFDCDAPSQPDIKVDVRKADDTYQVKAELPGVKKADINVSIEGNQVTIAGEVRKETEEKKGEEVIRRERYYGRITRSFTLPRDIDEAKAKASYSDGVLELVLPTKAPSSGRRLTVN